MWYNSTLTSLDTGEVVESDNRHVWTTDELELLQHHDCHFIAYRNNEKYTESYFCKGNTRHRLDGPAHINYDEDASEWWIRGEIIHNADQYMAAAEGLISDEELMLVKLRYW